MKLHVGLVVVAVSTIGCGVDELDTGATEQQATRAICPDPEECTLSNGGGVYTQEVGNAHIGPNDLMLTHFINQPGGGVTLEGREFDAVNGAYFKQTTDWVGARYLGVSYSLFGVYESATVPQFRLLRTNGTPFNVTGNQILDLELIVEIKPAFWTISFKVGQNHGQDIHGNPDGQLLPGPGSQHVTVNAFDMFWNPGQTRAQTPQPYCHLAPKLVTNPPAPETDPVVFQQGIVVNAVNAVMTPMNNYVTLSCLHGALATVAWWGYDDHTQPELFEAAMHMKRASYCGDDSFYTRRNTTIMIRDTVGNLDNSLFDPLNFEASWGRPPSGGPIRALCYTPNKERRPNALYPPHLGADFNGQCANAPDILPCAPGAYGSLASQKSP